MITVHTRLQNKIKAVFQKVKWGEGIIKDNEYLSFTFLVHGTKSCIIV